MNKPIRSYKAPTAGDVVWCLFPYKGGKVPGPKPRPGIILRVSDPAAPGEPFTVVVCYGTSNVSRIYSHDFLVEAGRNGDEMQSMGLSFNTKFDMSLTAELAYTSEWFHPPPNPRFGQTPKLGVLPAASVSRLVKAHSQANRSRSK